MGLPNKKVKLDLLGLDGDAFSLMGAFSRQAKRESWSKEEIDSVLEECRSGDYDHLLQTLIRVTGREDDDESAVIAHAIVDEALKDGRK